MICWTVVNQKGGVGKTTTAVTLAGWLVRDGYRVLLVDLDPQASLTGYLMRETAESGQGVFDLFMPEPDVALRPVRRTAIDGMDLIAGSPALATLDRKLSGQPGQGLVLARYLQNVARHYDFALIDCPPTLGVLMINAIAAADRLLMPVQTEHLALKGLERMLRTLSMVQRTRKSAVDYLIIPSMYDRRTRASIDSLAALNREHGAKLWGEVIPVDTRFREASERGQPIPQLFPESRGARAYRVLLDELLDELLDPQGLPQREEISA
ncbi:MAG: ParA family protein [Wenzhouxiangellaceae bacterium]|nr:ParA family protein [Wenzhouxiangellaceae bacterium]